MEVPDVEQALVDHLAVELHGAAEHAVRRRMLGADVELHLIIQRVAGALLYVDEMVFLIQPGVLALEAFVERLVVLRPEAEVFGSVYARYDAVAHGAGSGAQGGG